MKRQATLSLFLAICLIPHFLRGQTVIPLTIEYARTEKEKAWGLMQRPSLPENHGMLFIYDSPQERSFWMFNCLIDLTLACLDKEGVILEILPLKAFPQMMDPARQVRSLDDMTKYPPDDPILLYFLKRRATCPKAGQLYLEMEAGWFQKHGIHPGDQLEFNLTSSHARIIKQ